MTPYKLDLFVATFSYGGNGGIASEHPDVRRFITQNLTKWKDDERVGELHFQDFCDTPITMTRNRAVMSAKAAGADLLLMIDSDMAPDVEYLHNEPGAKPFWDSSFDFVYNNYLDAPSIIAAPYCGPPPDENVYVFRWVNSESNSPDDADMRLDQFSRADAYQRTGIEEVGALPTGLILCDLRCFDLTTPKSKEESPWFDYEWTDMYAHDKGSTEDVMATRDLSLASLKEWGRSCIYVNWDAWAGHWKPKCVRKPRMITSDLVSRKLYNAAQSMLPSDTKVTQFRSPYADEIGKMPVRDDNDLAVCIQANDDYDRPVVDTQSETQIVFNRETGRFSVGFRTSLQDHDELARLVNHLKLTSLGLKIAEVGSWVGESACTLADAMGTSGELHCVDTWTGASTDETSDFVEDLGGQDIVYDLFVFNTRDYDDRITTHIKESTEAAKDFENRSLDLVFIDAGHTYEELMADISAWLPKVRHGGILCGHDYGNDGFPGVKKAVDERFGSALTVKGTVWSVTVAWDEQVVSFG